MFLLLHILVNMWCCRFLLLSVKSSSRILGNSLLSDVFCKSCGLFSHSFDSAFPRAEMFNSSEVQLLSYFLMDCAFGVVLKKSSPCPRSSRFPPVLPFMNFTVLHFTFRSAIYFELIFLKDIRSVFRFICLHVNVHLFEYHLFHCMPLLLYQRSVGCIHVGLFLGSIWNH